MGNYFFPSRPTDYMVYVHTWDRKFIRADINLKLVMYDDLGNKSDIITLNTLGMNDLTQRTVDTYHVPVDKARAMNKDYKVSSIEFTREGYQDGCDWYVEKIIVENRDTFICYNFPVLQWVKKEEFYSIPLYNTSLPQFDKYSSQRSEQLKNALASYKLDQKIPGGPVQVKVLPDEEVFSFTNKLNIVDKARKLSETKFYQNHSTDEFESINDINTSYDGGLFTRPVTAHHWDKDEYFGLQRLVKLNPSLIELVTVIPDKLPVTNEMLKPFLSGLTIADAIKQKRLFMVDLHILDGIPTKEGFVVCAPIALFYLDSSKKLKPVAIQLNQRPDPDNPIFTPDIHPTTWSLVKMWFNNADACHHQSITHFGLIHFVMEGFALATNRHLAGPHPIYKLLIPHLLYVMSVNDIGITPLLSDDGWVEQFTNCGKEGMYELIRRGLNAWRLDVDGTLPENLKRRGVLETSVLPIYHYRDDAMLVYKAIHKYVSSYVNYYYSNTDKLKKDWEIRNWANELVKEKNGSQGGMGFHGIPGNGELTSNAQLIQIATCIIFTCTVSHAATNYPQYEEYSYMPKYPALMKGKPPTDRNVKTSEKELCRSFINQKQMVNMMAYSKVFSSKGNTSLADFEVKYFYEPKAKDIVETFRKDLIKVSRTINEKNNIRMPPYLFLDPLVISNNICT